MRERTLACHRLGLNGGGLYEFTLTDADTGERREVEARYTYEYEKRDGKWLIVSHRSSLFPTAG